MAFCSCRSGQALSSEGACPRQYVSLTMQPHLGKLRPPPVVSLCLETDRCLRVLLDSGQYLLEQGQGYRVRKQYEVIGIRAGYSNTAWIDFITTDDQCGGVHFKLAERLVGFHFDHETRKRLSRTVDCPHTRCSNSGEARPRGGGDGLRGFGTCLIFWISSVEGSQHADAPHALALLRPRRERPCRRRAAEQRDEIAPFHLRGHSITSSARASSVVGISIRIVLAVFRLMTKSNLLARCTGSSPGFSPLRMRPT